MTASLAHRYRDFGGASRTEEPATAPSEDALQDLQLASFENGYQAGWDDAVAAQSAEAESATTAMAQSLQDMAFTHHEAYRKLTLAMKPLLTLVAEKVLPQMAQRLVGAHLVQQLSDLMKTQAQAAIEIAVAPGELDALKAALDGTAGVPFTLRPDPALGPHEAQLRLGDTERHIDVDAVLRDLGAAFDAFFDQLRETDRHD